MLNEKKYEYIYLSIYIYFYIYLYILIYLYICVFFFAHMLWNKPSHCFHKSGVGFLCFQLQNTHKATAAATLHPLGPFQPTPHITKTWPQNMPQSTLFHCGAGGPCRGAAWIPGWENLTKRWLLWLAPFLFRIFSNLFGAFPLLFILDWCKLVEFQRDFGWHFRKYQPLVSKLMVWAGGWCSQPQDPLLILR